jgi:hypothetical protein
MSEADPGYVDFGKLSELAETLTEDQRRLLREGLGGGQDLDPQTLGEALRSFDTEAMFARLEPLSADAPDAGPADAGTGDAGTGDAGTGDAGGTPHPVPVEPPLTRW